MKKVVVVLFFWCFLSMHSQVGISTTSPNAQLDVRSSNQATPSNNDGLLIPKIDAFPATNPTAAQQGMMVYLTAATTFSGNPKTEGFYYWDNVSFDWISVGNNQTSGWSITGNSGINSATNFIGTLNNADVIFKRNSTQAGLIGSSNTSFGITALNPLTTGNTNSAFGIAALFSNTTGVGNSAFGGGSLVFNTTGNNNSAFGAAALNSNTLGFGNSAFGASALRFNTTGIYNDAFGLQALTSNTSGVFNAAFGVLSLHDNTTGENNVAFGFGALNSNTTGNYNSAFGVNALSSELGNNGSSAFGYSALMNNTSGVNNSAFGSSALEKNTTGHQNNAFGIFSMYFNTTGRNNVAMGTSTLYWNTIGQDNVALGNTALFYNDTGNFNVAVGAESLYDNTTGSDNVAVGATALSNNISGTDNTALGYQSLLTSTNGFGNVSIGRGSMYYNTIGSNNVSIGRFALFTNATGSSNTAIGTGSLNSNVTGSLNTAVGSNSDMTNGITNATAIGANAYVTTSNSVVIGGIGGVNGCSTTVNVGIGTTSPQTNLDVTGYNVNPGGATDGNLLVRTRDMQNIDIGGSITLGGMADSGASVVRNFASIEGRKANAVNNSQSGYLMFKTNSSLTLVERMRITATGDVGIGTITPGGQFELSLNEGRKPGSTTWTVVSDSRLKTVDGAYTKGLNEIVQLQPIRYHYKNNGGRKFEQEVLDTEFSGFIAQEVQPLFPDAVQEDEDGFLSFNMHSILVASINAIKELNTKVEVLENENNAEKNKIILLQDKLNELEKRLKVLEEKLKE